MPDSGAIAAFLNKTCTGIDVQGKSMPSKLEIFKVLMKPDVRDAVMKVSTAFQEAGINPKVR